jgi:hypothetical protein
MFTVCEMTFCAIAAFPCQKPSAERRLVADVDLLELTLVMRECTLPIGALSIGQKIWTHPGLLQIWGLEKLFLAMRKTTGAAMLAIPFHVIATELRLLQLYLESEQRPLFFVIFLHRAKSIGVQLGVAFHNRHF